MKCKHCNAEIPNDSNFCEYCGKRVRNDRGSDKKGAGLWVDSISDKKGTGFWIGSVCSVIFPLVGFILYGVKRKENPSHAKTYLLCALAGIAVRIVVKFISMLFNG